MEARYLTDLEWRICHAVNIYVFRNGRDGEQPILVHIPPSKKKNMRTVMNVIQDRVKYPVGYAKFLYKMDGTRVKDPCELEMYNNYIVASNFDKHFKCAAYGRKRSPLLVLNRESKHVRVLKLQNQNYYEWLLKKKAVGEERPPYIYPTYYTNENYRPQDLPMGQMGNYQPPEVRAPGCCYPGTEGGRTYRVDGNGKYVVNTVTVDVTPDLADMSDIPRSKHKPHGNDYNNRSKYRGKMIEQTPSDMLNANVISNGTSQEDITVGTSGTEEKVKFTKKVRSSRHRKMKSHRVHVVTSEEYHEKQTIETSSQTSGAGRKPQKSSRKPTKRDQTPREMCVPPPPPAQFRDGNNNSAQQMSQQPHHQQIGVLTQVGVDNQDMLQYVDRTIHHDPNANINPSQKAFYYFPEKLAEINSSGNVQALELSLTHPQQQVAPGQWAVIQQPQQQILQPVYAIESQSPHLPHATAQTLIQGHVPCVENPSGIINSYSQHPQNQPIVQNLQFQPSIQQMQNPVPLIHTIQSQPVFHQQQAAPQQSHHPTQCVMLPNNTTLASSQQQLQPQMQIANGNLSQTPQYVAIQHPSQSHLQQVYQLGIVQQPNPQTCIQVDAKAMRQYVDNQKMIENRYHEGHFDESHQHQTPGRQHRHSREPAESDLDIPYTPLKTYRLPDETPSNQSNPAMSNGSRNNRNYEKRSVNPSRYNNDRLSLAKVKSRNVAIQMGHPGASARSSRALPYIFDPYKGAHSETSFYQNRSRNLLYNSIPTYHPASHLSLLSPTSGRGSYDQGFVSPRDRTLRRTLPHCFGTSYSDQYVNLRSSRDYPNHNPMSQRRFAQVSDPILDELVTIPPPTEFREHSSDPMPLHFSRHAQPRHQNNNYISRSNHMYPYANDRSEASQSQYMYSQYP